MSTVNVTNSETIICFSRLPLAQGCSVARTRIYAADCQLDQIISMWITLVSGAGLAMWRSSFTTQSLRNRFRHSGSRLERGGSHFLSTTCGNGTSRSALMETFWNVMCFSYHLNPTRLKIIADAQLLVCNS